jgi:uncharacterized protein
MIISNMTIKREIEDRILELAKQYPVITITGPRQSGKTTLCKRLFAKKKYFSLENPDIREFAEKDPRGFLKEAEGGVVLDEIQNSPQLLSYIQGGVDEQQQNGLFILTGSQQFELMKGITQSLAGRTAIVKLLPFSLSETHLYQTYKEIDDYLLRGFYPRIWDKKQDAYNAYMDYFESYIQRDLRNLINIKDLSLFRKFVRLCAGRVGQVFNASSFANDIGVSVHTINSWVSILETSFIIFLLPPYYENIGKRLIKSPKLYFYDVGLASYLLGIENKEQMKRDRVRGSLVENCILMELLKSRFNKVKDSNLYFYRDKNQKEIDVLIKKGSNFNLLEIKAASTFNMEFLKNINYLKKILPESINKSFLIYTGTQESEIHNTKLLNFLNCNQVEV